MISLDRLEISEMELEFIICIPMSSPRMTAAGERMTVAMKCYKSSA